MKTLFTTIILSAVICFSSIAQECKNLVQFKEGTSITQKSFNAKDKLGTTNKLKVLKVEGNTSTIKSELYDKNDKLSTTSNYSVKCENGNFLIDMKSIIPTENMEAFKDMDVKAEGDFMEIPNNLSAGQTLKDAIIHMTMNLKDGSKFATMDFKIHNRKVEAKENVTTPAGTYPSTKISYDYEMVTATFGIPMKFSGKGIEWFAPEVGVVRSESFNKNGKLQGYTVVTEIKYDSSAGPSK